MNLTRRVMLARQARRWLSLYVGLHTILRSDYTPEQRTLRGAYYLERAQDALTELKKLNGESRRA